MSRMSALAQKLGARPHRVSTPPMVSRRNELAHIRSLITEHLKELEVDILLCTNDLELRQLEAERDDLEQKYTQTTAEWDRIWLRGVE